MNAHVTAPASGKRFVDSSGCIWSHPIGGAQFLDPIQDDLETDFRSVEAEQDLIGIILADHVDAAKAFRSVKPVDFSEPLHGRIFCAAQSLRADGKPVSARNVAVGLTDDVALFDVGGLGYLNRLAEEAYQRRDIGECIEIVRGWAEKRLVMERLSDPDTPLEHCMAPVEQFRAPKAALSVISAPDDSPAEALRFESIAAWHGQPIPEREWAVLDRIPARNVTLLSGEGAAGKTLLTQQLGVACHLGNDWLGVRPTAGPFMGLYCEDDRDELHRRFASIAAHYSTTLAALPDLHALSFAGRDAILAVPDRTGVIQPTELFTWLLDEAKRIRPKILTIDNAADVYAGNENDRAQVRQFIGLLRRIAIEADTAVLLTAHPSLTGLNTGSGISGSTAWHASVRARMYLRKAKGEGDERADPDERTLEVMKSNYGPAGETVSLRWKDGLFLPSEGTTHWLDKRVAENGVDDLFLRLLAQFDGQGRNVSATPSAPTYAPTMFERDPSATSAGIKKATLAKAMARLFAANKIHVENYGRPSRPNSKIVTGAAPT